MGIYGFEEGAPWCPLCEEYDHSLEDCPLRDDEDEDLITAIESTGDSDKFW